MKIQLHNNDCLIKLKELESNSVDSIVTDPPYEISFMSKGWDGTGIAFNTEVWKECLRVLKPGGHILAFGATRTYHRMTVAIEDAGFEIRDCLFWCYGSGFPKSHNIGNGIGTALKPAVEPVIMGRKPFKGNVAGNVLEWGTGGLNIDECRIGTDEIKTNGYGDKGFVAREGYEPSTHQGRWPANLILDEEAGKLLDEQSTAGASRFFYCPKVNKKERGEGNNHPTVKPVELLSYLIRLVTPKEGIVLDPFMGSGSTGKAAIKEGMGFIGIEKEEEYFQIAQARIEHEAGQHKYREFF